jgi:hypothetical protein
VATIFPIGHGLRGRCGVLGRSSQQGVAVLADGAVGLCARIPAGGALLLGPGPRQLAPAPAAPTRRRILNRRSRDFTYVN